MRRHRLGDEPASRDEHAADLFVEVREQSAHLATLLPLDKEHADRRRRAIADEAAVSAPAPVAVSAETAPLLRQYMAEYAATGLPHAYVPHAYVPRAYVPHAYVPHDTSAAHDTTVRSPTNESEVSIAL